MKFNKTSNVVGLPPMLTGPCAGHEHFVVPSHDYLDRPFNKLVAVKVNGKFTWIHKDFRK